MPQIEIIPCLSDNYAYLIKSGDQCAVVDPSEPEPVRAALASTGWKLTHILNTHHHLDHTGGNLALKEETGALVVGPGKDAARTWAPREAIICLFTDGVTEALGVRGDRFGEERVLGHVARSKDRSAREILESVHADLAGFTGGAPPADDRTVVIVKV